MIDFLEKFQAESEPCLENGELEFINSNHKKFFDKIFADSTICYECAEQCLIPKTKDCLCPQKEIDIADFPTENFERDKFSLERFLQAVAQTNNIKFLFRQKDQESFYFGSKNIDDIENHFYYLRNLATKNQITETAVQRIEALKTTTARLVILTPDNIIQDNKIETIINLESCLKNDYIINVEDLKEYDLIVNAETLTIKIYDLDFSLDSSSETFAYIYNLALHPREILDVRVVRNFPKTYNTTDKTLYDATRKINDRLILKLKEEFKKHNKTSKHLDYLIKVISQSQSFYLNLDKEKIKIIGNLPV